MVVLCCGGRNYNDQSTVNRMLALLSPSRIIHGGASGADALCDEWARGSQRNCIGVTVDVYPAEWSKHGKAAGPIRNQEMVDAGPDVVVAFPGGSGTADCVRRARKAGIPVIEVR